MSILWITSPLRTFGSSRRLFINLSCVCSSCEGTVSSSQQFASLPGQSIGPYTWRGLPWTWSSDAPWIEPAEERQSKNFREFPFPTTSSLSIWFSLWTRGWLAKKPGPWVLSPSDTTRVPWASWGVGVDLWLNICYLISNEWSIIRNGDLKAQSCFIVRVLQEVKLHNFIKNFKHFFLLQI